MIILLSIFIIFISHYKKNSYFTHSLNQIVLVQFIPTIQSFNNRRCPYQLRN